MSTADPVDIDEVFEVGTPVDEALQRGVRDALRVHKRLGNTVVVWRDGCVVRIPPEEIVVPDEPNP